VRCLHRKIISSIDRSRGTLGRVHACSGTRVDRRPLDLRRLLPTTLQGVCAGDGRQTTVTSRRELGAGGLLLGEAHIGGRFVSTSRTEPSAVSGANAPQSSSAAQSVRATGVDGERVRKARSTLSRFSAAAAKNASVVSRPTWAPAAHSLGVCDDAAALEPVRHDNPPAEDLAATGTH
jgi:hypothetical protein